MATKHKYESLAQRLQEWKAQKQARLASKKPLQSKVTQQVAVGKDAGKHIGKSSTADPSRISTTCSRTPSTRKSVSCDAKPVVKTSAVVERAVPGKGHGQTVISGTQKAVGKEIQKEIRSLFLGKRKSTLPNTKIGTKKSNVCGNQEAEKPQGGGKHALPTQETNVTVGHIQEKPEKEGNGGQATEQQLSIREKLALWKKQKEEEKQKNSRKTAAPSFIPSGKSCKTFHTLTSKTPAKSQLPAHRGQDKARTHHVSQQSSCTVTKWRHSVCTPSNSTRAPQQTCNNTAKRKSCSFPNTSENAFRAKRRSTLGDISKRNSCTFSSTNENAFRAKRQSTLGNINKRKSCTFPNTNDSAFGAKKQSTLGHINKRKSCTLSSTSVSAFRGKRVSTFGGVNKRKNCSNLATENRAQHFEGVSSNRHVLSKHKNCSNVSSNRKTIENRHLSYEEKKIVSQSTMKKKEKEISSKTLPNVSGDGGKTANTSVVSDGNNSANSSSLRRGTFTKEDAAEVTELQAKRKDRRSIMKTASGRNTKEAPRARSLQVHFAAAPTLTPRAVKIANTPVKTTPSGTELSMRERLDAWLKSKGKTPSRFRHLRCFGHELSAKKSKAAKPVNGGLSEEELTKQQAQLDAEEAGPPSDTKALSAVEDPFYLDCIDPFEDQGTDDVTSKVKAMLDECMALFEAGCGAYSLQGWLEEISQTMPQACTVASYWTVKARFAEESGENDLAVVDIFEEAVRNNAEPPDEVADALRDFVARLSERRRAHAQAANTPRHPPGVDESNIFESSSVKYCVLNTTPFFKSLRGTVTGKDTPQAVITPVRRSTRRSCTSLPKMLQDHDVTVDTLKQLSDEEKRSTLFKPNKALLAELEEAVDETDD